MLESVFNLLDSRKKVMSNFPKSPLSSHQRPTLNQTSKTNQNVDNIPILKKTLGENCNFISSHITNNTKRLALFQIFVYN